MALQKEIQNLKEQKIFDEIYGNQSRTVEVHFY